MWIGVVMIATITTTASTVIAGTMIEMSTVGTANTGSMMIEAMDMANMVEVEMTKR